MFNNYLFLTSNVPYKGISGDRIATFNTMEGIKKLLPNAKVGILTFYSEFDKKYLNLLSREIDFIYPIKKPPFIKSILGATLKKRSVIIGRFFSKEYIEKLKKIAKNYDVISAEHTYMGQYFKFFHKQSTEQKFIVNIHTFEFPRYDFLCRTGKNIFKKLVLKYECQKLLQEEIDIMSGADFILSYGEVDAKLIRKYISKVPIRVQSLPMDINLYEYSKIEEEKDGQILFFGEYKWFPNYDALMYILKEIWPSVISFSKKIKLKLIGRHIPLGIVEKIIRERKLFNIEVKGEVKDIQPSLKEAAVIIAPLRIGGGVRLKILESLAIGKVVITTNIGAEGILNKDALIIANDPIDFAKKIVKFSLHKKEREPYKKRAREIVKNIYDFPVSINTFLNNLNS